MTTPRYLGDLNGFGHRAALVGNAGSRTENAIARIAEAVANVSSVRSRNIQKLLDPRRNINDECGYPDGPISAEDHWRLYDTDWLAAKVVKAWPRQTWLRTPEVYEEPDGDAATEFEEAFDDIGRQLRGETSLLKDQYCNPLWGYAARWDELIGAGKYAVIVIGTDDGLDMREPAEGVDEEGSIPLDAKGDRRDTIPRLQEVYNDARKANKGRLPRYVLNADPQKTAGTRLTFVQPLPQVQADVIEFEANPRSPRYGLPTRYNVTYTDPRDAPDTSAGFDTGTREVHWTRVVHGVDHWHRASGNRVFGVERVRPVLPLVLAAQKPVHAGAEGYWQSCFNMLMFETYPELGGDPDVNVDRLKGMFEEMMNGMQRWGLSSGGKVNSIAPSVVDPTPFVDVLVNSICILIDMPRRTFEGSEEGVKAGEQDSAHLDERTKSRNHLHGTSGICAPLIDRLVLLGCLPKPKQYYVDWPTGEKQADEGKANVFSTTVTALGTYIEKQVDSVIAPHDMLTHLGGFDPDEAEAILENAKRHTEEKRELEAEDQKKAIDEGLVPDPREMAKATVEVEKAKAVGLKKGPPGPPAPAGGAVGGKKPGFPPKPSLNRDSDDDRTDYEDYDTGETLNASRSTLTGGKWVTISGSHVYIKGGRVAAGPKALKSKLSGKSVIDKSSTTKEPAKAKPSEPTPGPKAEKTTSETGTKVGGGKSFTSPADAETHFKTTYRTKLTRGKMSDGDYTTLAGAVAGEYDRLTSEFGAVARTIKARTRDGIPLKLGEDFSGEVGSGKGAANAYTFGGGIRMGAEPLGDHTRPNIGGHSVSGGKDIRTSFRHELAHEVFSETFSRAKQAAWQRASNDSIGNATVSRYGGTSHSELFSESFAAYTSPLYERGALPKKIEGWLDKNLGRKSSPTENAKGGGKNNNPRGCNQHTVPGCAGASHSPAVREAVEAAAANVRDPSDPSRNPTPDELPGLIKKGGRKVLLDAAEQLASVWADLHGPGSNYSDDDRKAYTDYMKSVVGNDMTEVPTESVEKYSSARHEPPGPGVVPGDPVRVTLSGWLVGETVVRRADVEKAGGGTRPATTFKPPKPFSTDLDWDGPLPSGNAEADFDADGLATFNGFDPAQPRDDQGQWTDSGNSPGLGTGVREVIKLPHVKDDEGEDAFDVRVVKNPTADELKSMARSLRRSGVVKAIAHGDDLYVWKSVDEDVHHQPVASALGIGWVDDHKHRINMQWDDDLGRMDVFPHSKGSPVVDSWVSKNGYVYNYDPNQPRDDDGKWTDMAVFRGGPEKTGKTVTYHTTDRAMAESYVEMFNDRFGAGGAVRDAKISIRKPAPPDEIEKEASRVGIDNEGYTPASVFDSNLHGEDEVARLVKKLISKGYDGAVLDDIAYGTELSGKAYITFTDARQTTTTTKRATPLTPVVVPPIRDASKPDPKELRRLKKDLAELEEAARLGMKVDRDTLERYRRLVNNYDPNQPRVPKGQKGGGRFGKGGAEAAEAKKQIAAKVRGHLEKKTRATGKDADELESHLNALTKPEIVTLRKEFAGTHKGRLKADHVAAVLEYARGKPTHAEGTVVDSQTGKKVRDLLTTKDFADKKSKAFMESLLGKIDDDGLRAVGEKHPEVKAASTREEKVNAVRKLYGLESTTKGTDATAGPPTPPPNTPTGGTGAGGGTPHPALPKNPKKVTIDQATAALKDAGYELGTSKFDLKTQTTTYELTHPDGSKSKATADEVKKLAYEGTAPAKTSPTPQSKKDALAVIPGKGVETVLPKLPKVEPVTPTGSLTTPPVVTPPSLSQKNEVAAPVQRYTPEKAKRVAEELRQRHEGIAAKHRQVAEEINRLEQQTGELDRTAKLKAAKAEADLLVKSSQAISERHKALTEQAKATDVKADNPTPAEYAKLGPVERKSLWRRIFG